MSDVSFDLNGKTYSVPPCPNCGDESLSFDAGMMGGVIGCVACGYRIIRSDIFEAMDAWEKAAVDNKSQSNDNDMSSTPGHTALEDAAVITESDDCDNSQKHPDDCQRNDTLPPVSLVIDLSTYEGKQLLRDLTEAPDLRLVLWKLVHEEDGIFRRRDWAEENLLALHRDGYIGALEWVLNRIGALCDDHGIRMDEE